MTEELMFSKSAQAGKAPKVDKKVVDELKAAQAKLKAADKPRKSKSDTEKRKTKPRKGKAESDRPSDLAQEETPAEAHVIPEVTIDDSMATVGGSDVAVQLGPFMMTRIGLRPSEVNIPFEEWERVGSMLGFLDKATPFMIADWINYGDGEYGEKAAQAIEATQLGVRTIDQYVWVGKSVPLDRRVEGLTFAHHRAVAALTAAQQKKWLAAALENDWPSGRLLREIKAGDEGDEKTEWPCVVMVKTADEAEALATKLRLDGYELRIPKALRHTAADPDDSAEG